MALRKPQSDVVSATESAKGRNARAEFVWYVVLCVVWGAVLVAGVTMAASVSPLFCRLCHSEVAKAQAKSSHTSVACDDCHVDTEMLGLAENRLQVVGMVAATPLNAVGLRPYVASAATDNKRCLACHANLLVTTTVSHGIRMSHAAPQKEGWACATCHRGTAHPDSTYKGASFTMDMCLRCHSAAPGNLSTCSVCHVEDAQTSGNESGAKSPWEVTHGSQWKSTHGMGDLDTCKSCHASSYCAGCHGIDLPHPDNFLRVHGQTVLAYNGDASACYTCHSQSACESCHGMPMPHPAGFVREHQETYKQEGKAACARCHAQSSCNDCHTRHTHPGIPPDQLKLLQESPVKSQ